MAYIATGARTKQTARGGSMGAPMGAIPGLVDDDPNPLDVLRTAVLGPATQQPNNAAGLAALRAAAARGDSAALAALRAANQSPAPAPVLGRQIGDGTDGISMTTKLLIGAVVLGGAAFLLARK